jgi:hypothetical protein
MELKENGLPGPEHNLYEIYKTQAVDQVEGADICIRAIEATLKHFKIPKKSWPVVGNVVLRLSHVMGEQDQPVQIPADAEAGVHFAFDLYEHYNRVCSRMLTNAHLPVKDGQHQFGV